MTGIRLLDYVDESQQNKVATSIIPVTVFSLIN